MENQNTVVSNPETIKPATGKESVPAGMDYKSLGHRDAENIAKLVNEAQYSMKHVLLERAEQFANNEKTVDDWLDGFGEVMGSTKKSEARAVIEAFYINPERVTIESEKAGFNDFIKSCREIRGKRNSAAGKASKVTDKQQAKIVESVAVMTPQQASTTARAALGQIVETVENYEPALLLQIEDICQMLGKSEQPIYKAMADQIGKIVSDHLDKLEAEKAQETAKSTTEQIKELIHQAPAVPQPLAMAA